MILRSHPCYTIGNITLIFRNIEKVMPKFSAQLSIELLGKYIANKVYAIMFTLLTQQDCDAIFLKLLSMGRWNVAMKIYFNLNAILPATGATTCSVEILKEYVSQMDNGAALHQFAIVRTTLVNDNLTLKWFVLLNIKPDTFYLYTSNMKQSSLQQLGILNFNWNKTIIGTSRTSR